MSRKEIEWNVYFKTSTRNENKKQNRKVMVPCLHDIFHLASESVPICRKEKKFKRKEEAVEIKKILKDKKKQKIK